MPSSGASTMALATPSASSRPLSVVSSNSSSDNNNHYYDDMAYLEAVVEQPKKTTTKSKLKWTGRKPKSDSISKVPTTPKSATTPASSVRGRPQRSTNTISRSSSPPPTLVPLSAPPTSPPSAQNALPRAAEASASPPPPPPVTLSSDSEPEGPSLFGDLAALETATAVRDAKKSKPKKAKEPKKTGTVGGLAKLKLLKSNASIGKASTKSDSSSSNSTPRVSMAMSGSSGSSFTFTRSRSRSRSSFSSRSTATMTSLTTITTSAHGSDPLVQPSNKKASPSMSQGSPSFPSQAFPIVPIEHLAPQLPPLEPFADNDFSPSSTTIPTPITTTTTVLRSDIKPPSPQRSPAPALHSAAWTSPRQAPAPPLSSSPPSTTQSASLLTTPPATQSVPLSTSPSATAQSAPPSTSPTPTPQSAPLSSSPAGQAVNKRLSGGYGLERRYSQNERRYSQNGWCHGVPPVPPRRASTLSQSAQTRQGSLSSLIPPNAQYSRRPSRGSMAESPCLSIIDNFPVPPDMQLDGDRRLGPGSADILASTLAAVAETGDATITRRWAASQQFSSESGSSGAAREQSAVFLDEYMYFVSTPSPPDINTLRIAADRRSACTPPTGMSAQPIQPPTQEDSDNEPEQEQPHEQEQDQEQEQNSLVSEDTGASLSPTIQTPDAAGDNTADALSVPWRGSPELHRTTSVNSLMVDNEHARPESIMLPEHDDADESTTENHSSDSNGNKRSADGDDTDTVDSHAYVPHPSRSASGSTTSHNFLFAPPPIPEDYYKAVYDAGQYEGSERRRTFGQLPGSLPGMPEKSPRRVNRMNSSASTYSNTSSAFHMSPTLAAFPHVPETAPLNIRRREGSGSGTPRSRKTSNNGLHVMPYSPLPSPSRSRTISATSSGTDSHSHGAHSSNGARYTSAESSYSSSYESARFYGPNAASLEALPRYNMSGHDITRYRTTSSSGKERVLRSIPPNLSVPPPRPRRRSVTSSVSNMSSMVSSTNTPASSNPPTPGFPHGPSAFPNPPPVPVPPPPPHGLADSYTYTYSYTYHSHGLANSNANSNSSSLANSYSHSYSQPIHRPPQVALPTPPCPSSPPPSFGPTSPRAAAQPIAVPTSPRSRGVPF